MSDIAQKTSELLGSLSRGERIVCIHYSCASFYDNNDAPTPVSAIGVIEITGPSLEPDEQVFAITGSSDKNEVVAREKEVFEKFIEYVKEKADARWVHWKMKNPSYGFSHLKDRYEYLFEESMPVQFQLDRLYDLSSIIAERYGDNFAMHPRFRSLCSLNNFHMPCFMDGPTEARAYSDGRYEVCRRSTVEKTHHLASLLNLFQNGNLKTAGSVGVVGFAGEHLEAVKVILELGEKFIYVSRELEYRHGERSSLIVKDEYDAQDLLRSLLRIFFDDVRPEDYVPSYAGASSRIDFVIPEFKLAVELKHSRSGLDEKKIGEQLLVDRQRYEQHNDVQHLICLVFDYEGKLRNPRGLEKDLNNNSSSSSFAVTVKIYDR